MAKYTIELRRICDIFTKEEVENWFKDYSLEDYLRQDEIASINQAGIWNKDKLARKIVEHYFMREIGFETPYLFKHFAKVKMQEIMERMLPLIYSSSIKYDPLINVDYTETLERNVTGTAENEGFSNSSSSNNSSSTSIGSDTPQGRITKEDILNGIYASNSSFVESESSIKDNTSNNSTGSSNTDENYTKKIKGNSGVSATAQKMIEQYRNNIIAIDENIINELNSLFMRFILI